MKRQLTIIAALASVMTVTAQETYENARLATEDLNGTARYVGMGGAMEALGSDLSVIKSNPAGIGLFRRPKVSLGFGVVSQQGAEDFADGKKTNMSFDQLGFVYTMETGDNSFVNIAFNYHKSRNFNHILSASGLLSDPENNRYVSQNKASWVKNPNYDDWNCSTIDALHFGDCNRQKYGSILYDHDDELGNPVFLWAAADDFIFNRANTGYIGEYDLNISGNIDDRWYLGATVGIHDVHYNGVTSYIEGIIDVNDKYVGDLIIEDDHSITGMGVDLSLGVIFRPIEYSPFRVGFSISTPTFYDLSTESTTTIFNETTLGVDGWCSTNTSYDFAMYTPWKFGLSAGTTFMDMMAVGLSVEYADYSSTSSRYKNVTNSSWVDSYENTEPDRPMNAHTRRTLQGVFTTKLGMEVCPAKGLAFRCGYNYVSPMYKKNGLRDQWIESDGTTCATTTDFTNWGETQRLTAGFGYTVGNFSLDLAYQYQKRDGTFFPFASMPHNDPDLDLTVDGTKVSDKRHQLLLTLGYNF